MIFAGAALILCTAWRYQCHQTKWFKGRADYHYKDMQIWQDRYFEACKDIQRFSSLPVTPKRDELQFPDEWD